MRQVGMKIETIYAQAVNLHVYDERMSDLQQNIFFTLYMLCLLLLDHIEDREHFDRVKRRLRAFIRAHCNYNAAERSSAYKKVFVNAESECEIDLTKP